MVVNIASGVPTNERRMSIIPTAPNGLQAAMAFFWSGDDTNDMWRSGERIASIFLVFLASKPEPFLHRVAHLRACKLIGCSGRVSLHVYVTLLLCQH